MKYFLFIPVLLLIFACQSNSSGEEVAIPALKVVFEDDFMVGTALNRQQVYGEDVRGADLVEFHFNTITPENVMKWALIHPELNEYNFEPADRFVELGEENDMFMVGHTLVWHSQIPDWVFEGQDGNPISREALLERMRDHIHTVVGRYNGRVQAWDVVNEALNEDGSLRESLWYEIIGKEYLLKAFEYAHEADPEAELYYNDYSLENPDKRAGAVRLIEYLQENDAPITGIGTQGHFHLRSPGLEEVENTIVAFGELGIDVMVTELDIDVLPSAMDYQGADVNIQVELEEELNPYPEGLPESVQQDLAERYDDLFEIFIRHHNLISRVTFWGVTDGDSWKNNWPVRGRTNYPLLFDRNGEPKQAFHAVISLQRE